MITNMQTTISVTLTMASWLGVDTIENDNYDWPIEIILAGQFEQFTGTVSVDSITGDCEDRLDPETGETTSVDIASFEFTYISDKTDDLSPIYEAIFALDKQVNQSMETFYAGTYGYILDEIAQADAPDKNDYFYEPYQAVYTYVQTMNGANQ